MHKKIPRKYFFSCLLRVYLLAYLVACLVASRVASVDPQEPLWSPPPIWILNMWGRAFLRINACNWFKAPLSLPHPAITSSWSKDRVLGELWTNSCSRRLLLPTAHCNRPLLLPSWALLLLPTSCWHTCLLLLLLPIANSFTIGLAAVAHSKVGLGWLADSRALLEFQIYSLPSHSTKLIPRGRGRWYWYFFHHRYLIVIVFSVHDEKKSSESVQVSQVMKR